MNNKIVRTCKTCKIEITEGYCVEGGKAYYCNNHEPADFLEDYALSEDTGPYLSSHASLDTYWTQWDD